MGDQLSRPRAPARDRARTPAALLAGAEAAAAQARGGRRRHAGVPRSSPNPSPTTAVRDVLATAAAERPRPSVRRARRALSRPPPLPRRIGRDEADPRRQPGARRGAGRSASRPGPDSDRRSGRSAATAAAIRLLGEALDARRRAPASSRSPSRCFRTSGSTRRCPPGRREAIAAIPTSRAAKLAVPLRAAAPPRALMSAPRTVLGLDDAVRRESAPGSRTPGPEPSRCWSDLGVADGPDGWLDRLAELWPELDADRDGAVAHRLAAGPLGPRRLLGASRRRRPGRERGGAPPPRRTSSSPASTPPSRSGPGRWRVRSAAASAPPASSSAPDRGLRVAREPES